MKKEIFLKSNTNLCDICVQIWEPEKEPKAILQISHGMAEYVERYEDFANYLNSLDILVIGNDHCGHGKSVPKDGIYGYFGENNGWENLTKDLKMVHDYIQKQYPTLPYILFGHSMGSFLARTYAAKYGENIDAFIFCGTAGKNPILGIAKMIAKSQIKSKGSKTPSPFIDNLAFGTFNKAFSPNRTASDWLTRVDEEVDRYIAHPWCGFIFTTSAFAAMFDGLSFVQSKEWPNLVPKKPILLIAGDKDPVGSFGKGVTQVEQWLLATDHSVKKVLYPEARHEILNETNRYEVYEDIASFVKNAINI